MIDLTTGDTALIISECERQALLRNQCAYVLATAYWETARTVKPVREYGGEAYLRSKRYYPYVGMGYVQLTWKANYEKASDELGVDFVADPRKLLEPAHAVTILVTGMIDGWFTGRRLADDITLQKSDFVNARRIINGTDRKEEIAAIAREYDRALKSAGFGEASSASSHAPPLHGEPPGVLPGKPQTFWTHIAALFGRLFYRR